METATVSKREEDEPARADPAGPVGAHEDGGEVPEEIGRADEPHLGVRQVQRRGHRGEQHPEGEAAETEAREDAEHPREDDHPPVMEHRLAGGGILHVGKYNMVFARRSN